MSFVFLTEAGTKYGVGHLTRCDAIAQALSEQRKESVFIVDAPTEVLELISHESLPDIRWQDNWALLSEAIARLTLSDDLEGIFIDSYHAAPNLLERLTTFNTPLFFMGDYRRIEYPKGVIINPEVSAYEGMYHKKSGRRVYAGIRYIPLRRPFWDMEVQPYIKRKGIVVTLGGSGDQGCLNIIMKALSENISESITLVADGNQALNPLSSNIKVVDNRQSAEFMQTLISGARIVICGGGGTLIEAARAGAPAIVVKMADNQHNNVKAWTRLGFARYAGNKSSPELGENTIKYLAELDNFNIWREASASGSENADGQGARRIAEIMLGEAEMTAKSIFLKEDYTIGELYLKNFLHCNPTELEAIRSARNSSVVRESSINRQIITINNQQAFILTLGVSTTGGYWLAHSGGAPAGVVSLTEIDWRLKHATLGYYKLPDYYQKGVGKVLVSAAKELTFNKLALKRLFAECLSDNIASIKSMEAAGLKRIGHEERQINGKSELIYKYEVSG